MTRRLLVLLAAAAIAAPAMCDEFRLGGLVIQHPWSRPTADGMPMGVAYLSITNHGKAGDTLVAASTPVAGSVEIHQTTLVDGMARMRPLAGIEIAPGATVKVEPGGIHLMLVDLKAPLALGQSVPLTLEFRAAGRITVQLKIESDPAS